MFTGYLNSLLDSRQQNKRDKSQSPPVRWVGLEPLEERVLLTTTVFLDFGIGVGVGNTISIDAEDFRDIFGSNTGTDLGLDNNNNPNPFNDTDQLDFTPLAYDFDFDGDTDNTDLTLLAQATLPFVQRVLEPFDINIQFASASDFTDPVTSVGNNAGDSSGEFDSYVFLMSVTSGGVGVGTGLRGQAAVADLANAHAGNTVDEAVITFIDNVLFNLTNDGIANNQSAFATGTAGFNNDFAQALAYTAIHEVYHTFSIRHTPDENGTNPQASANQRLLASGDVIRRGSRTRLDPFMVTRYDLQRGTAVGENNNYLFTANDSDIGLRDTDGDGTPDLAYATGTGANDIVTFTDDGGGGVDVAVNPYSNQGRTSLIGAGETYNINLTTDTEGEILVDAGVNADQVVIDATINTPFRVRGGEGFDSSVSPTADQDLITLNSGGLSGTFTPDADGINGTVTYAGGATVDFSEFEDADADNVSIDTVNLSLSNGNSVDEGESFSLTVDFINIDTLDQHTITVDWGNGDTDMVVLAAGDRDAVFNYTYSDDHPATGTAADGFTISVTVTDDDGDSGGSNAGIVVNNVAPAITGFFWDQSVIQESETAILSGTFTDPALGVSSELFTGTALWSDGVVTVVTVDGNLGTFTTSRTFLDDHPATGTPSDQFTVKITIDDDDTGTDTEDSPALTVENVAPVIQTFESDATFDDKGMEGEPVTVTGSFTDIGVLDTHEAVVDWGDGSPLETITLVQGAGNGTFTGQHAYTFGGIYNITVTVTDDDTGQDISQTIAVITGVGLNFGELYIVGSNDGDQVMVQEINGGLTTRVHADFIPEAYRDYNTADIDHILAYLCKGDDHMNMAGNVTSTSIVHGGAGNDHLHGGGGSTVLLGDAGDDLLIGQSGRGVLIGGTGQDKLIGGSDQDILIGGSTTDDASDANLLALLAAWANPGSDYSARTLVFDGLVSVIDDAETDTLNGGGELDLFYEGLSDRLLGVKKTEQTL